MNGPHPNTRFHQGQLSKFFSCTETYLDLKGWQGNGFRPHSGNHVPDEALHCQIVQWEIVFKFNEWGAGREQEKKHFGHPAVVTGRFAKGGNADFHIFR